MAKMMNMTGRSIVYSYDRKPEKFSSKHFRRNDQAEVELAELDIEQIRDLKALLDEQDEVMYDYSEKLLDADHSLTIHKNRIDTLNTLLESVGTTLETLGAKYVRSTRFDIIGPGSEGEIEIPERSELVPDDFGGTTDAIVTSVTAGRPDYEAARDAEGNIIAADIVEVENGFKYILTSEPVSDMVCIIYRVKQRLIDFDSNSSNIIGD